MKDDTKIRPPRWADRFLEWYCAPRFLEEIQGDLHEAFHRRCEDCGKRRAGLYFIVDVFRSISFRTVVNPFRSKIISGAMFRNYLLSGWRNFLKYKSYSLINLFGLSIGFAAALLLFLIIRYENSFDRFHSKIGNIYRVGNSYTTGGADDMIVTPQIPLMEKEYPDIVHASRFFDAADIAGHGDNFIVLPYRIVDPSFGEMFDFKMVNGSLSNALSSPDQIVLTKSTAIKLFGNGDAMGKTVSLVNEKMEFTVAAIAEDPPKNSTLQFEALIPWYNAPEWLDIDQAGNWYNTFMEGYIEVAPGTSKKDLEQKLVVFSDTYFLEERRATWNVFLFPLADEHFRLTRNEQMISILGIIAGSILLISCINFTNLSVAQTLKRTKEIGLRRVLGSLKRQVTLQFLSESLITCSISMVVALCVTWLVLPYVNQYYDFDVAIDLREHQMLVVFVLGVCLLTGIVSSIGPTLTLSGLKPVTAIKGTVKGHKSGEYLRRTLIVLQFTASIVLLIGTSVVWQQVRYMKSQNLNFNQHNVVSLTTWPELFKDSERARRELPTIRTELEKETSIEVASLTSGIPGKYNENYNYFEYVASSAKKGLSLRKVYVDHNFFRTFDMDIVKGRDFSSEIESDKSAIVINEAAMKELGWTDLDGKELVERGGDGKPLQVVGVVKDYYYQSLKRSIQPIVHYYSPESVNMLAVRLHPEKIRDGLEILNKTWESMDAYQSFEYEFVDRSFDTLYKEQERLSATSTFFSIVALLVAGLGLLSITAYSVRLRRKEVSIRKVLGASVTAIIVKLSKIYGIMILVSFVLACPIIYFLAGNFLEDFAYRIELSPAVFFGVGLAVFAMAMLLVGLLSGKAAVENPVDALKEDG